MINRRSCKTLERYRVEKTVTLQCGYIEDKTFQQVTPVHY